MKRLLLLVPIVLVLLVGAAIVLPSFVDWNAYKAQIQDQVKQQAGLELVLTGNLRLSVLPMPHVVAEGVSIKPDASGKYETLLTLKQAEVYVNIAPLLSGQVSVSSVKLIEPLVSLEKKADGTFLGLDKLAKNNNSEGSNSASNASASTSQGSSISFDLIEIENGRFAYFDAASQKETIIDDVNGSFSAAGLYGPFKGKGSILLDGRIFSYDFESGAVKVDDMTSIKATIAAQPGNISLKYAGAAILSGQFKTQGNLEFSVESVSKTLVANNMAQENPALDGPLSIKGLITADTKGLEIKGFEGDLLGENFGGDLRIKFSPFEPQLRLSTQSPIKISKFYDAPVAVQMLAFDLDLSGGAEKLSVKTGNIEIDNKAYKVSGEYIYKNETGRPEAKINLAGKDLNVDSIFPDALNKKNEAVSVPKERNLNQNFDIRLPFDFAIKSSFDSVVYKGISLSSLKSDVTASGNALHINEVSIKDIAGSSVHLSGEAKNLSKLEGLNLVAKIDTKDAPMLLNTIGVDAKSLPQSIKKAQLKVKAQGSMVKLDVLANLEALQGTVIAQASVADVLLAPKVNSLTLQVKHPNMDEAIQALSGSGEGNSALSKPVDAYAQIQLGDKNDFYVINGMKADFGGMLLHGDAELDLSKAKPFLKGQLSFGTIDLGGASASSHSLSSSAKRTKTKSGSAAGRWSKEPIDLAGLNGMNADISIKADSLRQGGWLFNQPSLKVSLNDGSLKIEDFKSGLMDGNVALNAAVDIAPQPRQPIHIQLNAQGQGLDVGQLVKALAGSEIIKAQGRVGADVMIESSGLSAAALIYDLAGKGTIGGENIILDGVDVERFAVALSDDSKPGDSVLGLWQGVSKGGSTQFDSLDGSFLITEGIVDIQKMDLDGPTASILTTGKVDLPNWTLASKHKLTAKSHPDLPPFEMSFSGPLDNPAQTFGQGALNDFMQRKLQRKLNKVLGDKMDKGLEKKLGGIPGLGSALGIGEPEAQNEPSGGALDSAEGTQQQNDRQEKPQAQHEADVPQQQDVAPQVMEQQQSSANEEISPPIQDEESAPVQQEQPQEPQQSGEVKPEDVLKGVLEGVLQ